MKTRSDHIAEHGSDDPMHANWPLVRIIAYMLIGGILMAIALKISPPENPAPKPSPAQTAPRR